MHVPEPLSAAWIDERLDAEQPSALAREIALSFLVEASEDFADWNEADLRYPFTVGDHDISSSHEIIIQVADDFVTHLSNTFDEIDGKCAPSCGAELAYAPNLRPAAGAIPALRGGRIRRECPRCGTTFEPRARTARMRSGWMADAGNEESLVPGGVTFRFAIQIDCSNAWPREPERIVLRPELRALVESVFEQPFDDIGGFY